MQKHQTRPFSQLQTRTGAAGATGRLEGKVLSETKLAAGTLEWGQPHRLLPWSSPGLLGPMGRVYGAQPGRLPEVAAFWGARCLGKSPRSPQRDFRAWFPVLASVLLVPQRPRAESLYPLRILGGRASKTWGFGGLQLHTIKCICFRCKVLWVLTNWHRCCQVIEYSYHPRRLT